MNLRNLRLLSAEIWCNKESTNQITVFLRVIKTLGTYIMCPEKVRLHTNFQSSSFETWYLCLSDFSLKDILFSYCFFFIIILFFVFFVLFFFFFFFLSQSTNNISTPTGDINFILYMLLIDTAGVMLIDYSTTVAIGNLYAASWLV